VLDGLAVNGGDMSEDQSDTVENGLKGFKLMSNSKLP